jgi:hypothetical protein
MNGTMPELLNACPVSGIQWQVSAGLLFHEPNGFSVFYARPREPQPADDDPARAGQSDETSAAERRIVSCRSCRHQLADCDAAIEIDGRHHHTCVNPAGIVYRIACYREAPGCAAEGAASEYYSWFAGYAWQIFVCGRCRLHLGWGFVGDGERRGDFVGLIRDRIEERTA